MYRILDSSSEYALAFKVRSSLQSRVLASTRCTPTTLRINGVRNDIVLSRYRVMSALEKGQLLSSSPDADRSSCVRSSTSTHATLSLAAVGRTREPQLTVATILSVAR